MASRVNGTRTKEVLKPCGASKTKAIPIRKSRDALTGSSASGSKSRFQRMKDFLPRVGSSQNAESATPEESTTSTADTELQPGLSHSGGSSDDKQPIPRNYVDALSDVVRNVLRPPSEQRPLRRMQPEVRWLNQQPNRFLTIDSENYSLYELHDQDPGQNTDAT
ncbi:hypothetical protein AAVH_00926 [Aphelenchoides avenae]|nr:hypothetical protein AAVH_00926 [Aphelenchus avenae]